GLRMTDCDLAATLDVVYSSCAGPCSLISCWRIFAHQIAMILFGDPEHFNAWSPVPSNARFFLGPETSKPLMSLAGSFDIFTFWFMALLAIGFSEATHRKAKSLSLFWCFFGLWMVLVLIKMGFAMLA